MHPTTPSFQIVPFKLEHLEPACGLSDTVGWPHRRKDWMMMFSLSSGVVAIVDDHVVGTGFRTDYGSTLANISMIIVAEDARGKGLGKKIMTELMNGATSTALRLVSTSSGKPLYDRLGFVEIGLIHQFQGVPAHVSGVHGAVAARPDDLDDIIAFDGAAMGGNRTALIRWLWNNGRLAVVRQDGRVVGFAGLRSFGSGRVIGPVISEEPIIAKALISYFGQNLEGTALRIDIAETSGLDDFLSGMGMQQVATAPIMQMGTARMTGQIQALCSQALG